MHMSFTGERYVPELRGQIYYEHFHRYALVLELARDRDVLDIACGEGYGTAALALVARSALGVDVDATTVRHAAARYTAMNVDFRAGECTQIPAADAAFDLVVSFETIEHLTQQERMLAEIRRVLRPDGKLVISSPNKLVYSDKRSSQNPFHERELYFDEFRDMLRSVFPSVRLFGQRIFAASAVHPLRGAAQRTRWLGPSVTSENGLGALPEPEYFIAICAATDEESAELTSVYLDPRDELLDDIRNGGLNGEPAPQTALSGGGGHVALGPANGHADMNSDGGLHARQELDELEGRLRDSRATAGQLERTLREREEGARAAEGRLRELHAAVEDVQSQLREREHACAELERTLRERSVEAGERIAQVQHMTEHARGLELLLSEERAQNAELRAQNAELRAQNAELRTQDEELRARIETLEAREPVPPEFLQANLELEQRVETLSRELEKQQLNANHVDNLRRREAEFLAMRITELESAVDERSRALARAAEDLEELARVRDRLTGQHDAVRASLERAREYLAASEREQDARLDEIAKLRDEIAKLRAEIGELQARLDQAGMDALHLAGERDAARYATEAARHDADAADEARREAERSLAELQLSHITCGELAQRAESAERLLSDVTSSTSWRLTTPARRLMGSLRGRRKAD